MGGERSGHAVIIIDCEQGSQEWHEARLGRITASNFDRLLTAKTAKPSAQAHGYMEELLAEVFTGESEDLAKSSFMARGSEMEDEAIRWYSFHRTEHDDVRRVGFCLTDDRKCGCSPDALVGEDGGLEVKCLSAKAHIHALLNPDDIEHRPQVLGNLHVTGRAWWDRLYFHPTLEKLVVRFWSHHVTASDYMKKLAVEIDVLHEDMAEARKQLIARGWTPAKIKTPGLRCQMNVPPHGRWCMSADDVQKVNGLPQCAECREILAKGPLGERKTG